MARRRPPLRGKIRTREHVIGDLAVNHVERQALLGNATTERIKSDYGIDLVLFTFTDAGELEPGTLYIQVKATERLKWRREGAAFRLQRADLVGWLSQFLPVVLIVYDARVDRAYWRHVQGYIASQRGFNLFAAGKTITVHLDEGNVLTPASIRQLAALRDAALDR